MMNGTKIYKFYWRIFFAKARVKRSKKFHKYIGSKRCLCEKSNSNRLYSKVIPQSFTLIFYNYSIQVISNALSWPKRNIQHPQDFILYSNRKTKHFLQAKLPTFVFAKSPDLKISDNFRN
jgi:hypothetical protein